MSLGFLIAQAVLVAIKRLQCVPTQLITWGKPGLDVSPHFYHPITVEGNPLKSFYFPEILT